MRVTSFLARTEGNVAESEISVSNTELPITYFTGYSYLSAIFPYFYTYFPLFLA